MLFSLLAPQNIDRCPGWSRRLRFGGNFLNTVEQCNRDPDDCCTPGSFYLVHTTTCVLPLNIAESKLNGHRSKSKCRLTNVESSTIAQVRDDQKLRGSGIIVSEEIQDTFQRTIQFLLVD